MTDTIEQQDPPLWYEGQPWSKAGAAVKLAELDKDAGFNAALLKGDMVKVAERAAYSRMAKGFPAPGAGPPPQTTGDVLEQVRGRDLEHLQKQTEGRLEEGVEEITLYEQRNDKPILAEDKAAHLREIKRLKGKADFVRLYLSGDPDAKRLMSHHHVRSVMRVGTLAQVQEWEKAHLGKVFTNATP